MGSGVEADGRDIVVARLRSVVTGKGETPSTDSLEDVASSNDEILVARTDTKTDVPLVGKADQKTHLDKGLM